jgi:hypothetical protein
MTGTYFSGAKGDYGRSPIGFRHLSQPSHNPRLGSHPSLRSLPSVRNMFARAMASTDHRVLLEFEPGPYRQVLQGYGTKWPCPADRKTIAIFEQNSCRSTESHDLWNINPQRTRRNSGSGKNSAVLSSPVPCNHGRASLRRAPPFRAHRTSPPGLGSHLRDLCVLLFEHAFLHRAGQALSACLARHARQALR